MSISLTPTDGVTMLNSVAAPPLHPPKSPTGKHSVGETTDTAASSSQPKRRADKPLQATDPWAGGLDWGTIIWFSIVHLGALAAPFFFTWKALALFVGMYWLTGGLGICLGYHR